MFREYVRGALLTLYQRPLFKLFTSAGRSLYIRSQPSLTTRAKRGKAGCRASPSPGRSTASLFPSLVTTKPLRKSTLPGKLVLNSVLRVH